MMNLLIFKNLKKSCTYILDDDKEIIKSIKKERKKR